MSHLFLYDPPAYLLGVCLMGIGLYHAVSAFAIFPELPYFMCPTPDDAERRPTPNHSDEETEIGTFGEDDYGLESKRDQ